MASTNVPPVGGHSNPDDSDDDTVLADLAGITEIQVRVGIDPGLSAIELGIKGLPFKASVLLSDRAAVSLAVKLSHALGRLHGIVP
jgi:hypothetical protein